MDDGRGQEEYIRRVLEAYRKTPGTMGTVRRPDRMLAAQLYQRGVSVSDASILDMCTSGCQQCHVELFNPLCRRWGPDTDWHFCCGLRC